MATTAGIDAERLEELRGTFSGSVLQPGDERLRGGAARPQRPDRPAAGADRALPEHRGRRRDAVRFARAQGLEICVRGGGHNVAGRAVVDGAVMIDLADEGDPRRPRRAHRAGAGRRALARAQPRDRGARARRHRRRDLDHGDRRPHPRRRARLADGQVRARGRQPDRGRARHRRRRDPRRQRASPTPTSSGRSAAAAATSVSRPRSSTALHPLQMVTGGLIAHPIDAAREMLRFYRDAVASVLG